MKVILTTILFILLSINTLSSQELTGTLQQIQKSGKIKIGYRQSQPPMSFLGSNGMPAGYSIDLCKNIVAEINKKMGRDINVEYIPVTAEERFHALADNKIDILCGATTKTLSRSELADFTQLTFVTGASFMTLKGKTIRGDFTGKNIGVIKGTTTVNALKELFKENEINANIILLNSAIEGVTALERGKIDAFAADQVALIGLAISVENKNIFADNPNIFSVLTELFSYEPLALAVRRNDADFRLVADRVISNLCRSKQILAIYDKWFGKFFNTKSPAFETLVKLNAIPE